MMPIQPLAMLDAVDNQSKEPIGVTSFEQQWTLVFIGKNGCDLSCEASLFKVRQMRFLLGRELQRVQYMFLALDEASAKAADALAEAHPRMTRATVTPAVAEQQARAFGDNPIGNFYLIDPHGNLVRRYDKEAEVEGILKDLHKLLKVSKIG
jgi:cytochrome oxidase Cu insertion factor (SCO1/SenC/PrrC family)